MNQGRYSVANLQKTTIFKTNVDLVNADVYTKFDLILSIRTRILYYIILYCSMAGAFFFDLY